MDKRAHCRFEDRRRQREVARNRLVDAGESAAQIVGIRCVAPRVRQRSEECVARRAVDLRSVLLQCDADVSAKRRRIPVAERDAEHREVMRERVAQPPRREGRREQPFHKVARGADDDEPPDHAGGVLLARTRLTALEISPIWLNACG